MYTYICIYIYDLIYIHIIYIYIYVHIRTYVYIFINEKTGLIPFSGAAGRKGAQLRSPADPVLPVPVGGPKR